MQCAILGHLGKAAAGQSRRWGGEDDASGWIVAGQTLVGGGDSAWLLQKKTHTTLTSWVFG